MKYLIADQRHPFMGLNNKICKNPIYWCRLHQVWLSEGDVKRKHCMNKISYNMMEKYKCGNLERKVVKKMKKVPIKDKLNLTIEEAAAYSGISERVLRDRIAESNYNFILKNGTKTLIKRRLFEKYLESVDAI